MDDLGVPLFQETTIQLKQSQRQRSNWFLTWQVVTMSPRKDLNSFMSQQLGRNLSDLAETALERSLFWIKFPVEDLIFLMHSSKTSHLVPVEQHWTWRHRSESQKHAWTRMLRVCRNWYRPYRMYFFLSEPEVLSQLLFRHPISWDLREGRWMKTSCACRRSHIFFLLAFIEQQKGCWWSADGQYSWQCWDKRSFTSMSTDLNDAA